MAGGGPLPHAETAGGGSTAVSDIWPILPASVEAMRFSASRSLLQTQIRKIKGQTSTREADAHRKELPRQRVVERASHGIKK